ncbi:hypothetical protein PRIPAC_97753 [Pristionchus pacificus]|uniref:Tyr recombinase domain-containing protein n=1 Tax=Pristionchus pacificus TaxID=54126 RepID=A0A8R1Z2F6_PRIPA|nr:hypothetical protein PRIPAC_97753 [Pristionchus pacificus]|eukprot:PDM77407.1 hypothetical protein PRIPAC_33137 [Pristionchus pacificus]
MPCRGSSAFDAFSHPSLWRLRSLLWCVPPPSLLCQTLAWLRGARAKGVLGVPYWTSLPVFPSLFPPNHTPRFVKDYLMFPVGTHILNPGSYDHGSAGETLRSISDVINRCDPSLMPVLTNSIDNAKAQSTMRSYKGSFAKLRDYARERGLDPACPTSLVIYSLKKMQEGRAISSLRTLSASFSHFVSSPPPFISQILSHLHLSTRRKYTVSHHANVPRSYIDSFVLFANSCPNDVACIRTALGASLSFCALLRVSELLALKWDDLNWCNGLLRVSVNKAKNDQFALGRKTFIAVDNDSPTLALFHQYRSVVPVSPWLFPSLSNPEVPIRSDTFRQDLALLCYKTGIDKITPHQLRAGGAICKKSVRRGTSIEEVQRRGRWNSPAGLSPTLVIR